MGVYLGGNRHPRGMPFAHWGEQPKGAILVCIECGAEAVVFKRARLLAFLPLAERASAALELPPRVWVCKLCAAYGAIGKRGCGRLSL